MLNGKITLNQETQVRNISSIKDYEAFIIGYKRVLRINFAKEQYIAQ